MAQDHRQAGRELGQEMDAKGYQGQAMLDTAKALIQKANGTVGRQRRGGHDAPRPPNRQRACGAP